MSVVRDRGREVPLHGELVQPLLERLSSPMETTHDRSDRDVEDLGDLFVGESLHVRQQHGHPEVLRQRLQRLLHLCVGEPLEELLLGAAAGHRGLEAPDPPIEIEVLDLVELGLVGPALLRPVAVDVGVGEDAVEPGLEVGALLEPVEAAVRPEVGLLDEVLCVGRVAGHAQCGGIERRHEPHRLVGERRPVGHVGDPTRSPGSAQQGVCCRVMSFQTDIPTLRERARTKINEGPITDAYGADRTQVIDVLNQALATEIICVLRYKRHYFMADGINGGPVAAEFLQHANEELGHADQIALRITQLQGEPNFSPAGIETRSHSEYVEGSGLVDMIKEDLVAERIAIESYAEIVKWLGDKDPTTRRLMEEILAVEEEHADDLLNLLADLEKQG